MSGELKYACLIYLFGFCSFGAPAALMTAALRSALGGYAAVYLLLCAKVSVPVYFMHTGFTLLTLGMFCGMGRVAANYASRGRGDIRSVLDYSAKCLFCTGIIFILIIIRHLTMLAL